MSSIIRSYTVHMKEMPIINELWDPVYLRSPGTVYFLLFKLFFLRKEKLKFIEHLSGRCKAELQNGGKTVTQNQTTMNEKREEND